MRTLGLLGLVLFSFRASAVWELEMRFDPTVITGATSLAKVVRWDINDPTPNPIKGCYNPISGNSERCRILVIQRSSGAGGWGPSSGAEYFDMTTEASNLFTMGELGALFAKKGFLNKEMKTSKMNYPYKGYCYSLGYISVGSVGSYLFLPSGKQECVRADIVPTICSIAEPYIELDHGGLNPNQVNGNSVSQSFTVTCNQDFYIRIIAQDSNSTLSLGGGITSHLQVNGTDLGTGYEAVVGPAGKAFTLTSSLSGTPNNFGDFQSSKIILLSLP
ncbi:TPA: hypothetical protein QIY62_002936 [Serratia marcescens]|nr:hypothetical protein [Serratia marcescens]